MARNGNEGGDDPGRNGAGDRGSEEESATSERLTRRGLVVLGLLNDDGVTERALSDLLLFLLLLLL